MSLLWLCFSSLLKTAWQTFLPLTRVVDVIELVAAGSEEASQQSLPSADPVSKRDEGYPWRNQGAARIQGATTQDGQCRLVRTVTTWDGEKMWWLSASSKSTSKGTKGSPCEPGIRWYLQLPGNQVTFSWREMVWKHTTSNVSACGAYGLHLAAAQLNVPSSLSQTTARATRVPQQQRWEQFNQCWILPSFPLLPGQRRLQRQATLLQEFFISICYVNILRACH